MTLNLTGENYNEILSQTETASVTKIEADFTGLSKPEIRATLKLCKEKLTSEGSISVANIKKNTLILAGFGNIQKLDNGNFQGFIPQEVKAVNFENPNLNQAAASSTSTANDTQINPDSLLTEKDKEKPKTDYDCGVSLGKKRQACKGCTCGLAEELEDEAKNKIKENIDAGKTKPSCGSCYLGDAFRCASCPFAGMPAFEKGAPPKLANADDFNTADI